MKYKWLNQKNNQSIIIFFNGWGMDEAIVDHLNYGAYDILMFYDYTSPDCDFDFKLLQNYRKKYLVSWSMGVMTATLFKDKLGILTSSTAINGTLKPIDNDFGIPIRIYDLTLKGFNESGRDKFIKNMFNGDFQKPKICRDLENQKEELLSLKSYEADLSFNYTKIIISNNDKIIPTKNQVKFWSKEPNLNSGHAPFLCFKTWEELL